MNDSMDMVKQIQIEIEELEHKKMEILYKERKNKFRFFENELVSNYIMLKSCTEECLSLLKIDQAAIGISNTTEDIDLSWKSKELETSNRYLSYCLEKYFLNLHSLMNLVRTTRRTMEVGENSDS